VEEYTDEETPEVSAEETAPAAGDDSAMRKLKQENQSLRQRLRRTELEANFGKDVVELIPEELPLAKWEEYAGRLAERLQKPEQTKAETPEAAPETPEVPEPAAGLKAVATNQPASTPVAHGTDLTSREIGDLYKTDPAAFKRALQAKYAAS
jgi:hypothetical protein